MINNNNNNNISSSPSQIVNRTIDSNSSGSRNVNTLVNRNRGVGVATGNNATGNSSSGSSPSSGQRRLVVPQLNRATSGLFPQYADQPDIVRASQKDDFYKRLFEEQVFEILTRLAGPRVMINRQNESKFASNLSYFILTTMLGAQTLGEEYCNLRQIKDSSFTIPGIKDRCRLLFFQLLAPYLVRRYIPKVFMRFPNLFSLKELMPKLERLHLALFYFNGSYYEFSKRLSNIRYIFNRKVDQRRPKYHILGLLIIIQLIVSSIIYLKENSFFSKRMDLSIESLFSPTSSDGSQQSMDETQYNAQDEEETSSEGKCTLCLETRKNTTSTIPLDMPPALATLSLYWLYLLTPGTLPSTLTSLTYYMPGSPPIPVGVLPQSLRILDIWTRDIIPTSLPPSLKELILDHFNLALQPNMLPSSITKLKFREYDMVIAPGTLPSSLTHLSTGPRFNRLIAIGVLPESLLSLKLGRSFKQRLAPGTLPLGLATLNLENNSYNQELGPGCLPPSLASMTSHSHAAALADLPDSITFLTLCEQPREGCVLPISLTKLCLEGFGRSGEQMIPGSIPPTLTYLDYNSRHKVSLWGLDKAISITTIKFGLNFQLPIQPGTLPQSLTTLKFAYKYSQPLPAGCLPQSLTKLTLGSLYNQDVVEFPQQCLVDIKAPLRYLQDGVIPRTVKRFKVACMLLNFEMIGKLVKAFPNVSTYQVVDGINPPQMMVSI
ncbi:hypothetical protein SAMD00019534_037890 [Acytostelium subglobosum LB1]|uniref:hypothetical protein n=1 Tax=Acytostelium subglobosum LB1 TaxID=1410327 RepID=UPI0006448649|nr:hypothetical protein SAMD00019534_037890 [Acytostelium subglobosum LB1]GAM20614.1 hypothetical protein SAMD00019534_037890 [Acytostelium subglobosum LB1]|eukprot:XP_012760135.1 hypothetical protein SAMD00019534_037890 [Acytostelium subglobosum LB1]